MSAHNIQFHDKIRKFTHPPQIPKYFILELSEDFEGIKKRIRIDHVKRAIGVRAIHYENMPIQIYRNFHLQKIENFQIKNSDIFHTFAQNIDCGYSLEPPRRGGSNEYPQSMF